MGQKVAIAQKAHTSLSDIWAAWKRLIDKDTTLLEDSQQKNTAYIYSRLNDYRYEYFQQKSC